MIALLCLLWSVPALAQDALSEIRVATGEVVARTAPDARAALRLRLAPDEPFQVVAHAPPSRGCRQGWGQLAPDAWACLDATEVTTRAPRLLPGVLNFDPPTPAQSKDYRATNAWPMEPSGTFLPVLPYIYTAYRSRLSGDVYASLDSYLARGRHGRVDRSRKLAFSEAIPTERGVVLRHPDGYVVPLDAVWVYPASRFSGVDLESTPAPAGFVPGWTNAPAGTQVHTSADADAPVAWSLPFQSRSWVAEDPAHPGWLQVADPTGSGPPGWVLARSPMHWWRDLAPPDGTEPGLWVDVDLDQQVLALRDGTQVLYATMISGGIRGHETITGVFQLQDKAAWWEMASKSGSDEPYYLERVPWTMHFYPRYALHGAFWHDAFGTPVSHGCVNLAPFDAAYVFARLHPKLSAGWWVAYASEADPGSVLRVRQGQVAPQDHR